MTFRDPASAAPSRVPGLAKVPEITVMFWVIKLLTTGMGEAASDWLGGISIPLAAGVGLLGMGIALLLQLRAPAYRAPLYWAAVSMVAVFGTMAADGMHVVVGLSYLTTTILYILAVIVVFGLWYRLEGTLSIHSITTRRREILYWAAVLATFALGTAAGDLTAGPLHLGYFSSALIFGALIMIPLLGWRLGGWSEVVCFWLAYVLTRPLGASIADWIGKPHTKGGGLGFGDGLVTGVLVVIIVVLVSALARSGRDIQRP